MELNAVDLFCGAGGSTTGLKAAGIDVVQAANHWELAIRTHSENHPSTHHACVDLHQEHPAAFSKTSLLWASPECRVHSPAGGRKRKTAGQLHLWENKPPKASDVRSRMTAWDVLRAVEFHRQPYVVVENVIEFAEWELFDNWLGCFHKLGYRHQLVCFNSQFAYPNPVPQSRDRLYVVFHHQGENSPDLDFQPPGYCHQCQDKTSFVQSWKNPLRKVGRYGKRQQYVYRCAICQSEGTPYRVGAKQAIDWRLPTVRIGDREGLGLKPLSANTIRRIEKGLKRFFPQELLLSNRADNVATSSEEPTKTVTASGQQWLIQPFLTAYHGGREANQLINDPSWTIATNNQYALVNPFLVHRGYSTNPENDRLHSFTEPSPTLTTSNKFAVVEPFLDVLRSHSTPLSVHHPSATITAQGNHHALVQPFLSSYYGNGGESLVDKPSPTIRTHQGHALIKPDWTALVENCGYRMLKPHEAKLLMGFPEEYVLLGNQSEQFKQAGNAVTPPVAAMIGTAIKEALSHQAWV